MGLRLTYDGHGNFSERRRRCPHLVVVPHNRPSEEMRAEFEWCNDAEGAWFCHRVFGEDVRGDNDWGYLFENANTAFEFKMRFG